MNIFTYTNIHIYIHKHSNPNLVARAAFTRALEEAREKRTRSRAEEESLQKSPISLQKSPAFPPKSPTSLLRALEEARKKRTNS